MSTEWKDGMTDRPKAVYPRKLRFAWGIKNVPRVGLQCVLVLFPDHAHLHFNPMFGNQDDRQNTSRLSISTCGQAWFVLETIRAEVI